MHSTGYGGATISLMLLLKSLKGFNVQRKIYSVPFRVKEIKEQLVKNCEEYEVINNLNMIYNCQYCHSSVFHYLKSLKKSNKKLIEKFIDDEIDILHINSTVFPHHIIKKRQAALGALTKRIKSE